ncbi:asparaginase [Xinfangfangia sp. D13-10-4-6]|uniref:asparaginase n=1 Tax=Pseudogemmobacter hezensis TaxID=2737662 RepID=UPI0015551901|nr:asparaginase [Pseudogemmobacter hezensis]NPD14419.1 asparaginase [Pseudogemmobacter hezensis]
MARASGKDGRKVDIGAAPLAELWRGGVLESTHLGHVVICDSKGIIEAWGNPSAVIFPRSSCKMIQALPLIESGAAASHGLGSQHLALACASHEGAHLHVEKTGRWLADLGLNEADLRCGAHEPADKIERNRLIKNDESPCQLHNNCSGKHCGFLTVVRHQGWGPEYHEIDHPLQQAIRQATEELAGEEISGWGIDGCSAPNFAISLEGLGRAMAAFATAHEGQGLRAEAMVALRQAMMAHPDLVAGEGRACTGLMRAAGGRAAVKTGAEGVFIGILPERGIGVALKAVDGNHRASEAAIAAILVRLGIVEAGDPQVMRWLNPVQKNWRGLVTGEVRAAPGLM